MEETIRTKGELEHRLGTLHMGGKTGRLHLENAFGRFDCEVSTHPHYMYSLRKYSNGQEQLTIPLVRKSPSVVMIFQFGGLSVYRDKFNPFILPHRHHSLSYFNAYDCRSLVDEKAQQHDLTFSLEEDFYKDLVEDQAAIGNQVSEKILNHTEFNTIGARQPTDAGIVGVVDNILNCPFKEGFKDAYITAQLKALLILQICQFHLSVAGKPAIVDSKITARDRDILYAIREFLDENYLLDTSLQHLSRRFGLNEFKLKYGYRSLFNTSPIKYVVARRLDRAALLLRDTNKTIAEISDEVGYEHANNFSLAFRKYFGVAPLQYRIKGFPTTSAGSVIKIQESPRRFV